MISGLAAVVQMSWAVCLLAAQADEGAGLYKSVEEKIARAKTVRVKFSCEPEGTSPDPSMRVSGSLLLKEGNLLKLTMSAPNQPEQVVQVSDGERYRIPTLEDDREGFEIVKTPKLLRQDWNAKLGRIGIVGPLFSEGKGKGADRLEGWDARYQVVHVEKGERAGQLGSLILNVNLKPQKGRDDEKSMQAIYEVTVWFDPKSKLIQKRRVLETSPGEKLPAMVETYENWELDADLPDSAFKLPH